MKTAAQVGIMQTASGVEELRPEGAAGADVNGGALTNPA